jgi:hypothetical protein
MNIKLNPEQKLYVIPCGDGYSCFGFDNARDHAAQIATALKRPDLMPLEPEYGTLAGYDKYRKAVDAWAASPQSSKTYFDPGTPDMVRALLERYRNNGKLVRLFLGDHASGRDWGEENDLVGYIGRSAGHMRVPLLMEPGEHGGPAILTRCVVRILDVETGREVYRTRNYQVPDVSLHPCTDKQGYTWEARRDGALHARFKDVEEAAEWCGFIRGEIAAPRSLLTRALRENRRAA